ncbi:MAG: NTP transferase domain-containing protein [Acidobacteria bacterium]|nr:NTP transferase domain-containing protein [Acidobacteriota bacterium]
MRRPGKAAVILAGGDGVRLRAFTRAVSGEDRPKQFCRLLGAKTLLSATLERASLLVAPEHTLCVVTRHHEPFYREELCDVGDARLIVQPANRGTAAAFAYALARIAGAGDPDLIVGFFPSDHHYADPVAFHRAMTAAYAVAATDRARVFLIGAHADRAETDYGWIEPGPPLSMPLGARHAGRVRSVAGFIEKPSDAEAARLLAAGCLWNTFVVVGHQRAFRALFDAAAPGFFGPFAHVATQPSVADERRLAEQWYAALRPVDFSRDVLTPQVDHLGVVRLHGAGWTDLGQPTRVLDVMATHGRTAPARNVAV